MRVISTEGLACLSGLINTYLLTKNSLWNWCFGILTVSLYFFIFYEAKLYADASLQIIFLFLQCYGIYQWTYGGNARKSLPIQNATPRIYCTSLAYFACLFIMTVYLLKHYTDSSSYYADACLTAASLVAQWMTSKRYLQHWIVWIVIDIGAINLYLYKGLYLSAGLYFIYLFLGFKGYSIWKKSLIQTNN